MTIEAPCRWRDDPAEGAELRRALADGVEELPSESTLAELKSAVRLRIERGDPPRMSGDASSATDDLRAALHDGPEEFPSVQQLALLRGDLCDRLGAPTRPIRRRPRARVLALTFAIAALAAAAVSGYYLSDRLRPEPRRPAAPPPSVVSSVPTVVPPIAVSAVPTASPLPAVTAMSSSAASTPQSTTVNTAPATDEYALIREAQARRSRSPAESLALLSRHGRLFPAGALSEERERLAIECLLQLGRLADAKERASRFRNRYPDSVHWPTLKGMLERYGQATDDGK